MADHRTTCSRRPEAKLLTKGDNNVSDDTELYASGQDYLVRKDIIGYDDSGFTCTEYATIISLTFTTQTGASLPTFLLLATLPFFYPSTHGSRLSCSDSWV